MTSSSARFAARLIIGSVMKSWVTVRWKSATPWARPGSHPRAKQGDNPALVICNTCGAQTPADEPFCINCGQRLDAPRQEQPSRGSYYIPGVGPIHKNATIGDAVWRRN